MANPIIEIPVIENQAIRLQLFTSENAPHLANELAELVQDGELWKLTVTSAPTPEDSLAYIEKALATPDRIAFAVIDKQTNKLIGTTSYHDIISETKRLEIGYTFYGQSYCLSHVNTNCKLLLLTHAFETLGWQTVCWRTDNLNTRSQQAIERLGAKKDGVIRGHKLRKDGTVRDTVMYSMIAEEWAEAKQALEERLARYE